jgi:hypothetical protein
MRARNIFPQLKILKEQAKSSFVPISDKGKHVFYTGKGKPVENVRNPLNDS